MHAMGPEGHPPRASRGPRAVWCWRCDVLYSRLPWPVVHSIYALFHYPSSAIEGQKSTDALPILSRSGRPSRPKMGL